jgi:CheY-like chemotaxis protein
MTLSNSNSSHPRIVGLTANTFIEERESCLKAGMDDKLTKPASIEDLKAVLQATSKIGSFHGESSNPSSVLPVCDERQLNELLRVDGGDGFLAKEDPEVLASEAHKLKSAAGYVGAKRAAYFCGIVENAAKSPQPQLDQTTIAGLKESLNISVDDYRRRVKQI